MSRIYIHKPKPSLQSFYFSVSRGEDGKYTAKHLLTQPDNIAQDNTSVLELSHGDEKQGGLTGDTKYVLCIVWLSEKPEQYTEERGLGLMAVLNCAYLHLPPKVRKKLKREPLGLAHLPDKPDILKHE